MRFTMCPYARAIFGPKRCEIELRPAGWMAVPGVVRTLTLADVEKN
jgi:hypothetical protein